MKRYLPFTLILSLGLCSYACANKSGDDGEDTFWERLKEDMSKIIKDNPDEDLDLIKNRYDDDDY